MSYRAASRPQARRVVLVVCERPGELFLDYFWLITNWPEEQMDAELLLELYRERGTGEGHLGGLKSVLGPAPSSSPSPKNHHRGKKPKKRYGPCDAFAHNEAILLLNAPAYNVAHAARVLLGSATGEGWSLKRVRERALKAAARVLVHGRCVTLAVAPAAAKLRAELWKKLSRLQLAPAPGWIFPGRRGHKCPLSAKKRVRGASAPRRNREKPPLANQPSAPKPPSTRGA
jgi:hypothetical protein